MGGYRTHPYRLQPRRNSEYWCVLSYHGDHDDFRTERERHADQDHGHISHRIQRRNLFGRRDV